MNKNLNASFEQLFPLIQEHIQNGESFTFTAFGNSMYPFLRNGLDRVCLSPVTLPIRKFDVVFYRRKNGAFVLHRVIRVRGEQLTLCGDNQLYPEKGISVQQVIAILTEYEKNGKIRKPNSPYQLARCHFLAARRILLRILLRIKRIFS